ncbi:MAG: ferrous iron transport protein A [Eubacterium sp.]|nr:ferrous iron transport protein A [Eubacterium sp.]
MFLSELKDAQSGVISSINFSCGYARRLMDMGFCHGERVRCVCRSVFTSPILYYVKGSNIALRKCDADKIEVTL